MEDLIKKIDGAMKTLLNGWSGINTLLEKPASLIGRDNNGKIGLPITNPIFL